MVVSWLSVSVTLQHRLTQNAAHKAVRMASIWFTVAFWSLALEGSLSNPAPCALSRLSHSRFPEGSVQKLTSALSFSFSIYISPSSPHRTHRPRTYHRQIWCHGDGTHGNGGERVCASVWLCELLSLLHPYPPPNPYVCLCISLTSVCFGDSWTMQRMQQRSGEYWRWRKRTRRSCGKNTRWHLGGETN